MQREELWMIIDEIQEPARAVMCHFCICPHIYLKGRWLISAWKLKSMALVFGLGPKDGLSLEVGGVISDSVTSTCCDWTLIVSAVKGEKDMLMLFAFFSILALCSILSIWSMINNSASNKGCWIHIICLVVLIRMNVVTAHLFMTIPRGRLSCWACSTRQVILDGILLVCPGTVMTELLGTQTGFSF